MEHLAGFHDSYEGYLGILDSSIDEIEIPARSPKRPHFMRLDLDLIPISFFSHKGEVSNADDDDVSSAEYKLYGLDSLGESIFSTGSSFLPSNCFSGDDPQDQDLDEFLDEFQFDDLDSAEICSITNVVFYKYQGNMKHVHIVSL